MSSIAASAVALAPAEKGVGLLAGWRALLAERRVDRIALALGLCSVPVSIALAEALLSVALGARGVRVARRQATLHLPGVFWFWLPWAGLEMVLWILSPDRRAGWSEVRHLLLLAAMFFLVPALDRAADRLAVWRGIFLSSTLSGLFLIGEFLARLVHYRRELAVTADPSFYLRNGGLLNNWMVYGTVEILVVAGLVAFWRLFPEERGRWLPVFVIHSIAIVLSLTRMTWVACWLLLAIDLAWRRCRWFWAMPVLPLALYFLVPGVVRSRINESLNPRYFSNLERVEMLRVGWKMVRDHPLTGVGPGRVNRLYRQYLALDDPVPAYHGHLHNNLAQLAAEFGLLVVAACLVFVVVLFRHLARAWKKATGRETQFSCRAALLALAGFLVAGLFDYTYGHSLALILLCFTVLSPFLPRSTVALDQGALAGSP